MTKPLGLLLAVVLALAGWAGGATADELIIRTVDTRDLPAVEVTVRLSGAERRPDEFRVREDGRLVPGGRTVPIGETDTEVGVVRAAAATTSTAVFVVALGQGTATPALSELARVTGGLLQTAADPAAVTGSFGQVGDLWRLSSGSPTRRRCSSPWCWRSLPARYGLQPACARTPWCPVSDSRRSSTRRAWCRPCGANAAASPPPCSPPSLSA